MMKRMWLATGLALVTAACAGPKDAKGVLADAQTAMGNPTSIQYSGTGNNGFAGQALLAGEGWPQRPLTAYARSIDYAQGTAREEMTFSEPVFGGQQQNTEVAGDKAWNVGPNGPVPQPALAEERKLHILLTPHGFVRAALAAPDVALAAGQGSNTISFTALNKYKLEGTLDANNLLTKVATTIANPVTGDTDLVATYADYKDYAGVKFPSKIRVEQGGSPIWDLTVAAVTPNAPLSMPVPEAVASATVPPVQVVSTQLGPGVWHLTGGSHHSVVVDFKDYIAVIEAPLSEERSVAVLAEAKKLVPNKPVKYLLTTHHHFDHTGGLRTYAAEGATVVTHQSNVGYFEKTLAAPATVAPDAQAKARKMPMLQGVSDKFELTDGKQRIEVYPTDGDSHTKEYTLIYLPGPKVLVEADAYSPGPADAPAPAMPPPNAVKLYDDIQKLKLDVATIAPIHGRGAVTMAEFRKFVGK